MIRGLSEEIKVKIKEIRAIKKNHDDEDIRKIFEMTNTSMNYYPVNAWKIAREFGFEILETEFKDREVSGVVFVQDEVPEFLKKKNYNVNQGIILNVNETIENKSFTIAHEIAHVILHLDGEENYFESYHPRRQRVMKEEPRKSYFDEEKEDEADHLAARMLMPSWIFKKLVEESPFRNDERRLTYQLSLAFMVTEEAVMRRFKELNILFES